MTLPPEFLILRVWGSAQESAFLRLMLLAGLDTTLGVRGPPGPFHLLKVLKLYLTELLFCHVAVRTGLGADAPTDEGPVQLHLLHMCSQIVSDGKNDLSKPLFSQGYQAAGQQPFLASPTGS